MELSSYDDVRRVVGTGTRLVQLTTIPLEILAMVEARVHCQGRQVMTISGDPRIEFYGYKSAVLSTG